MRTSLLLLICSVLVLTTLAQWYDPALLDQLAPLIEGSNKFSLSLYKTLVKNNTGNVFLSPFSIENCLTMLYFMSNGKTQSELEKVLNFPSDKRELVADSMQKMLQHLMSVSPELWANKIFVDKNFTLLEQYQSDVGRFLQSESANVNFHDDSENVRLIINEWAENKTNGKIKELLRPESLSSLTKMVVISTVYFKQMWHYPFSKNITQKRSFNLINHTQVETDFMTTKSNLGYYEHPELNSKIIIIPYKNFQHTFAIILPNTVDDLPQVEQKLMKMSFEKEIFRKFSYLEVELWVPKFKIETTVDLKDTLLEMGIKSAFNSEASDFSRGTNCSGLEINAVHHKTYIEINEEGTEATAATGVILEMRIDSPRQVIPPVFVDRPFLFTITDSFTETILFIGRYTQPAS